MKFEEFLAKKLEQESPAVIKENGYYTYPVEIWDKEKCEKAVKYVAKDGLGTKYPWPGYIGQNYGKTRYNGGIRHQGNWYEGDIRPLPQVAEGFEIIHVPTWGYRIVKTEKND